MRNFDNAGCDSSISSEQKIGIWNSKLINDLHFRKEDPNNLCSADINEQSD